MSVSCQRFSLLLRQSTRTGQQNFSSSVKRVRQADGTYAGADEATSNEKSCHQIALKRSSFKWGEQVFKYSPRPKSWTSQVPPHRHFTTKAPYNINAPPSYSWNTPQLAPHVKYLDGAMSYETSIGKEGVRGQPERYSLPGRRHGAIMNKRGARLLTVKTGEGSNGIAGTSRLNQGIHGLSYQPAHKSILSDTEEQTSHNQPSKKPQSSLATQNVQRDSPPLQPWQVQKQALFEKFGSSGWRPRKRLAPDVLEIIRAMNSQCPEKYTTPVLAEQFKVSPEAIRRILKSKWRPNEEEQAKRQLRWENRGKAIWSQMVEIGIKPPKKWRAMGVKRE